MTLSIKTTDQCSPRKHTVDQTTQNHPGTLTTDSDRQSEFLQKNSKIKRCNSLPATITDKSPSFLSKTNQHSGSWILELARIILITADDLKSEFFMKMSPRFKLNTKVINLIKKYIPKDKRKILFDILNKFHPKFPETPHSFEEFERIGMEVFDEFEKSVRALVSEEFDENVCNLVCDEFRSEFLGWWASNLEQSYSEFINTKLSDAFNRKAVEVYIHDTQNLLYRPTIVCIGDITDSLILDCTNDITDSQSLSVVM